MGIKTTIPAEARKLIDALADEEKREETTIGGLRALFETLDGWCSEQDDARSERSDKWQESEAAEAHQRFLDRVQEIRDGLDWVLSEIDGMDFSQPTYGEG